MRLKVRPPGFSLPSESVSLSIVTSATARWPGRAIARAVVSMLLPFSGTLNSAQKRFNISALNLNALGSSPSAGRLMKCRMFGASSWPSMLMEMSNWGLPFLLSTSSALTISRGYLPSGTGFISLIPSRSTGMTGIASSPRLGPCEGQSSALYERRSEGLCPSSFGGHDSMLGVHRGNKIIKRFYVDLIEFLVLEKPIEHYVLHLRSSISTVEHSDLMLNLIKSGHAATPSCFLSQLRMPPMPWRPSGFSLREKLMVTFSTGLRPLIEVLITVNSESGTVCRR